MTAAENDDSAYTYVYNDLYQLTEVQFTDDKDNEYIVSYEYDKMGKKTKVTYPDSYYYYSHTYDDLNRLDLVKDRDNSNIADYTYDELNRRTRRDYLNGTWATYTYNDIGWLTDLVNWRTETDVISSFVYAHDNVGNRLTMTTSFGTQTYSYDKIYEVTGADYPSFYAFSDMTYQYDSCWNRESTVNGGTTNYVTNSLNQYSSVGGTSYSYDLNGNLITDGTQTYYYDCEGKLTKAVRNSDGQTLGEYKYNPFGLRIQKLAGADTTNYIYDMWQVIEERDGAGELLRHFAYGSWIDDPVIMHQAGENNYYHKNGTESVTDITSSTGNTVESYDYDIYGNFTSSGSLSGNPYTFTSRRYDPESGLMYYRFRYYQPEIGRFLRVDSLGYFDGPNLYTYVLNNPLNVIDPFGLTQKDIDLALELIRENYSEYDVPDTVYVRDLKEEYPEAWEAQQGLNGLIAFWTGKIKIDKKYLEELDCWEAEMLLDTLLHEIMHRTSSYLERLKVMLGDAHEEIYESAAEQAAELIDEYNELRKVSGP